MLEVVAVCPHTIKFTQHYQLSLYHTTICQRNYYLFACNKLVLVMTITTILTALINNRITYAGHRRTTQKQVSSTSGQIQIK